MEKFIKKQKTRAHKVSSVNLTLEQHRTIKELNLDLSALVRYLIDRHLSANHLEAYEKNKRGKND